MIENFKSEAIDKIKLQCEIFSSTMGMGIHICISISFKKKPESNHFYSQIIQIGHFEKCKINRSVGPQLKEKTNINFTY